MKRKIYASILLAAMLINIFPFNVFASSHREAPLIANDPLADNTDLYVFRSPDDPSKITIIANYILDNYRRVVQTITSLAKISVMKFILITTLTLRETILFTGLLLIK